MSDDPKAKVVLAYEVEATPEHEYEVRVMTSHKDKVTGKHQKFESSVEKRTGGFMVYFPSGHSIHVRDEASLAQLGLNSNAPLIDIETGEAIGEAPKSLKSLVNNKTRTRN